MARNRTRMGIGALMMIASLSVGVLVPLAASAADGVPDEREAAKVTKYGYWNADQSNYSKNAATSSFPPNAVCLVAPDACFYPDDNPVGALGNTVRNQLDAQERAILEGIQEQDNGSEPADPVAEDTLPVSVAFGHPYYRSAVDFALPPVKQGNQVDSFHVVLTQTQPTFASESPAFRQAVLAALTCAQNNPESPAGRCTQEEFEKVARDCEGNRPAQPCLSDGEPLLVEACPIIEDWEGEASQDEDDLPEVDCLYTAVGTPFEVEGATLWVFDLTFAAQAWYEGLLPRKGLLIRPGAAENFAYGDPETTYSKQVTFLKAVEVSLETSEPFVFDSGTSDSGFDTTTTTTTTGGDFFPTPDSSTTTFTTGGSVPLDTGGFQPALTTESPTVSDVAPQAPTTAPVQTLAANAPLGDPQQPWLMWLLVAATFLGGGYLLTKSLSEEAVVANARSGAMTRLLQRQAAAKAPDLVTG